MQTICIMVIGLATVAAPLPEDPAVKVVEKAVEAHGGKDVLLANKGCEMSGKMNMKWDSGDFDCQADMVYSLPDKYKVTAVGELANQKIVIVQTINGTKVKVTLNGVEIRMKPYEEAAMREFPRLQEILRIAPLLDASKYTLKADKDTTIGDAPVAVVIVSAKGMNDMKLFFNKETGLLVRRQCKVHDAKGEDTVDEVADYSDFKRVNRIQSPMTCRTFHDGKLYSTVNATSLKYHEKLDDKVFKFDE